MSTAPILFENLVAANQNSASLQLQQNPENFKFQREDWMLFGSLETLPQKAGVPLNRLRRLVLKELVDNALDAAGSATMREEGDLYIVEDNGPGMDDEPEAIARTFSIRRPMESSKMWRLPVRGALGNGLRVVAGAVLASGGSLTVTTRGMRHVLVPQNDGSTSVTSRPDDRTEGTRVEISFGRSMPADYDAMYWGELAIRAARGKSYGGAPSPFWYSADHFFEMLRAAGGRPVRSIIERLDGCTGGRAGLICSDYKAMPAAGLDRGQAIALLGAARVHAKPVNPARLGCIGADAFAGFYASQTGVIEVGTSRPTAQIPFVVEAWAEWHGNEKDNVWLDILVNRTPVTGEPRGRKERKTIALFGCGLSHQFEAERGSYRIVINVIAPYVPITTDGKEPDLRPFLVAIRETVQGAVKRAKRSVPKQPERRSQKAIVLDCLADAVAKASGKGEFAFNQRQLFYAVRPYIIDELGTEPTYGNFAAIITDFENEVGEIEGMHRDPRGTLYHPHTGIEIPLGTRSVATYKRPAWNFNKVLFLEKEGFFETLKAVEWPERYDCALMSSKGFSSRAARDFLDMLAEDAQEDITVFCVHDADASGTMIYQTLQEGTKARGRRKVEIVNLGLEPWEARAMALPPESVKRDREAPVADYVKDRLDGTDWPAWLQSNRYELNAMTMPQFIAWLDGKMIENRVEKVIPPTEVIRDQIRSDAEFNLRTAIQLQLLAEANFEDQVADALEGLVLPDDANIEDSLPEYLDDHPVDHWSDWASETARSITIENPANSN